MDLKLPVLFASFRLDPSDKSLRQGGQRVPLSSKPFEVLSYFVHNPGRLVTIDELIQEVWHKTSLSHATVVSCMKVVRDALGDSAKAPQLIATVRGHGYRFMDTPHSPTPSLPVAQPSNVVGREAELACLQHWLEEAERGRRQVVFVTGEMGIGKTAVIEAFRSTVATSDRWWLTHGECVAHYGAGEPYLPLLTAMDRLCRGPDGQDVVECLRRSAPTWLVQMPWLLSASDRELLHQEIMGVTARRMLREIAQALETLATQRPLLLILEDLHWSDHATVEVLAYLARRPEAARLLLLGTYRPEDVALRHHPLQMAALELRTHRQCEALALHPLPETGVAAYLTTRFLRRSLPGAFAQQLHQRTEGNPLFMVNVVDDLVVKRVLVEVDGVWELSGALEQVMRAVPADLGQLIAHRIAGLSVEEQWALRVGSVVGIDFSAQAVAAGADNALLLMEARCAGLVQRGLFLESRGVSAWPDGTVAQGFRFRHALYQHVLYEQIPAGQRVWLHQSIGARLERGFAGQTEAIAAALAMHFDRGREYDRARHYYRQAADRALQRSAHVEAIAHFTRALALLESLPETPARFAQELPLLLPLGGALLAAKGYTAPEAGQVYDRARALCQHLPESLQLAQALRGLWYFHTARGEHQRARDVGTHLLTLAERLDDPLLHLEAHQALGQTAWLLGDLVPGRTHLEHGLALWERHQHRSAPYPALTDPGVTCRYAAAVVVQLLGYPDQARQRADEALAQAAVSPFTRCNLLGILNIFHLIRREGPEALACAEAALALATQWDVPLLVAAATLGRGGALAIQGQMQEAVPMVHQGLAVYETMGVQQFHPLVLAYLAEALGNLGHPEEGLTALAKAQAIMAVTDECFYAAEIARLRGELLLQASHQAPATEAETWFHQAVEIARGQQAKWWELRAALSLARFWRQQGKRAEAHAFLVPVYGWFTEGFDTADLQEAKALIEALA